MPIRMTAGYQIVVLRIECIGGHRPPLQGSAGAESTLQGFAELEWMGLGVIGPSFRAFDRAGSDGIVSHVVPFLRIGFLAAEDVIEKAFLPVRGFDAEGSEGFGDRVL